MPKVNIQDWESYDDDNHFNYEKIRKNVKKDEKREEKPKNGVKKTDFSKK